MATERPERRRVDRELADDIREIKQVLRGYNGQDGLIRDVAHLKKEAEQARELKIVLVGPDGDSGVVGELVALKKRVGGLILTVIGGIAVALIVAWARGGA